MQILFNMKKKTYILLTILLMLTIWSCKTKKSTTDLKHTEIEKIGISDNSTIEKKQAVKEKNQETKNETATDKSFFEAWMSFESDKITITDSQGNKTEITNARYNKKQLQSNDILKVEQSTEENMIVATNEENQQNNIKEDSSTETKTDLQGTNKVKGREPVWLWVVGGCVFGGLFYLVLKRFKLI